MTSLTCNTDDDKFMAHIYSSVFQLQIELSDLLIHIQSYSINPPFSWIDSINPITSRCQLRSGPYYLSLHLDVEFGEI